MRKFASCVLSEDHSQSSAAPDPVGQDQDNRALDMRLSRSASRGGGGGSPLDRCYLEKRPQWRDVAAQALRDATETMLYKDRGSAKILARPGGSALVT